MSLYRTGNHWGVTIVHEGDGSSDEQGRRPGDELVAVVVNGDVDLAERICGLLNFDEVAVPEFDPSSDGPVMALILDAVDPRRDVDDRVESQRLAVQVDGHLALTVAVGFLHTVLDGLRTSWGEDGMASVMEQLAAIAVNSVEDGPDDAPHPGS